MERFGRVLDTYRQSLGDKHLASWKGLGWIFGIVLGGFWRGFGAFWKGLGHLSTCSWGQSVCAQDLASWKGLGWVLDRFWEGSSNSQVHKSFYFWCDYLHL